MATGLTAMLALATTLSAQATVLPVTTNSEAALAAAIQAANAMVFQTSAAHPVVIEFASNLAGQTFALTQALPVLFTDYVTLRVANAAPATRVILDATLAPTAFRISSWHASVQNVRFQNAGAPGSQLDVFTAFGTEDLTLSNCDFDGATGNSLWLIAATTTTVQDCGFHQGASGLVATAGSTGLLVQRCSFVANLQGVLLAVASQVQLRDCTFDGNGTATVLQPICADVTFGPANLVRTTSTLPAIAAIGTVRLQILGNQFLDNLHVAIQLRDLCSDTMIVGNTLARNGSTAADYQLLINNCVNTRIEALQCVDGSAGIFAGTNQQLRIVGSSTAPTTVSGHAREGIVLDHCTDVLIDQVAITANLQAAGGAQLALLGCDHVDVSTTNITAAPGPSRTGLRVDQCSNVRLGLGSVVHDHGGLGILLNNSTDLVLGNWLGTTSSLSVRGPAPLQISDCDRLQIAGTAATPMVVLTAANPTSIGVSILRCTAAEYGPNLVVDGGQLATTAMQIADSDTTRVRGLSIRGHTTRGLVAVNTPSLLVRNCVIDGGTGSQQASGQGLLLNPGCHGAHLFGNLVQRHQSHAFVVVDSSDVLLGPGNRAIDNGGDGFLVNDSGTGPPSRHATIQSSVAIGRGLTAQSGFHCTHMRANLTNVTATRTGFGINLQVGSMATLVNTISWGNTFDRTRDPSSSGIWRHGLRSSSAGVGTPGSWSEQDMLLGVNPQFVAAATGNVRLGAGSPAIDSGLHATPVGAGLPCTDADLLPRVHGGTIDRGAFEYAPAGPTGNTLDLTGPWLRSSAENQLTFALHEPPTEAGQTFLLLLGGSGTGPGFAAGGTIAPLVPDLYTGLVGSLPAAFLGTLDGTASATKTLLLPAFLVPYLPELTFVAVLVSAAPPTNPVVVRFLP